MANISADRIRTMAESVISGNVKKVALMLRAGVPADGQDDDGDSFLRLATRFAQSEVFSLLIDNGADINEPELLEWAVDGDGGRRDVCLEIVQRICDEGSPTREELNSALRIACVSGNIDVIEELIRRDGDPNSYDESFADFPLRNAVQQKNLEAVKLLMLHGADPLKYSVKVENEEQEGVIDELTMEEYARQVSSPEIVSLIQSATRR